MLTNYIFRCRFFQEVASLSSEITYPEEVSPELSQPEVVSSELSELDVVSSELLYENIQKKIQH